MLARPPAIADPRAQPFRLHEPIDAVLAAALAEIAQIFGDLAIAIEATAFQPGLLDQAGEALIFLLAGRGRVGVPGVVAAGMLGHHLAQPANRMLRCMGADERVSYWGSLAK